MRFSFWRISPKVTDRFHKGGNLGKLSSKVIQKIKREILNTLGIVVDILCLFPPRYINIMNLVKE